MKHKFKIILLISMLSFSVSAQQRYQLDNKKSKIYWKIETVGKHNGYILFSSGFLNYSAKAAPSTATFIMDMKKMYSTDRETPEGRAKIDAQLRSTDFFDVSNYPTATMVVQQILPTPTPGTYSVIGFLTIKGINNRVEFLVALKKTGDLIQANAKFKIDRTKWNIDHQPKTNPLNFFFTLRDQLMTEDIQISLDLYFNK